MENLNLFQITAGKYQKALKDLTEWKFIDSEEESILEKIYDDTITLKQFANNKIYSGIKTALNEAFVLSEDDAKELLDSESATLIKKYAKSTNIKKWELLNHDRYFLATGFDINVKRLSHRI